MIVPINKLKPDYGITPRGVIHIGAHYGQEYEDYRDCNLNMIFFEPVKANYDVLVSSVPSYIKCYQLALGNETGVKEMFVETANKSMSSSLLEPAIHLKQYPWITFDHKESVNVNKLDNIDFDRSKYNVLNIDVQGYELEVLKGSIKTLKTIDAIYIELNTVEMYKGCALYKDIDNYLTEFIRVADNVEININWGEGLYIRL